MQLFNLIPMGCRGFNEEAYWCQVSERVPIWRLEVQIYQLVASWHSFLHSDPYFQWACSVYFSLLYFAFKIFVKVLFIFLFLYIEEFVSKIFLKVLCCSFYTEVFFLSARYFWRCLFLFFHIIILRDMCVVFSVSKNLSPRYLWSQLILELFVVDCTLKFWTYIEKKKKIELRRRELELSKNILTTNNCIENRSIHKSTNFLGFISFEQFVLHMCMQSHTFFKEGSYYFTEKIYPSCAISILYWTAKFYEDSNKMYLCSFMLAIGIYVMHFNVLYSWS